MSLERFVQAQEKSYAAALGELKAGRKTGHWIWWIFPQLRGLGTSEYSVFYGLADQAEAKAYLAHPVLGALAAGRAGAEFRQQCGELLKVLPKA